MTTEDINLALKWSGGEVSRPPGFVTVSVATAKV